MRLRRIARKPWKSAVTGTWRSRVSRARSSPRCSVFSERRMERRHDADGSAGRVLIVDDHEDNVELLRARLESWGDETASAKDGVEALQTIESTLPDLVLLDIMMPKIDGIEVARRVKNNPDLPFIPIIMRSEEHTSELQSRL